MIKSLPKLALVPLNSHLGCFEENKRHIIKKCKEAESNGVDLVVFPELSLFGYHPMDLLERDSIVRRQQKILDELLTELPENLGVLIGAVERNNERGKPYFNSAFFIHERQVKKTFKKQLLPVYDVFDDGRHFEPGQMKENFLTFKNHKFLLLICEDMWGWDPLHRKNPILEINAEQCDAIINMSASPYTRTKRARRREFAHRTAKHLDAPLFYVNMLGGQDELIFDGDVFVQGPKVDELIQRPLFDESIFYPLSYKKSSFPKNSETRSADLIQSLVVGLRDFVIKIGLDKVHLGMSGGIDSAVVGALACKALGPDRVHFLGLPSPFNSPKSLSLAKTFAKNTGAHWHECSIEKTYKAAIQTFENFLGQQEFSLVHENAQARIRGLLLMMFANKENSLLLGTSNKSEFATGYTTLYGDMCSGLAVIGDLLKNEVYEVAKEINKDEEIIPLGIINRTPSAELRPNQKDSDSLPDYEILDKAVEKIIVKKEEAKTETELWVLNQVFKNEFKRWQGPPILKISDHGFGQGRRMPIAHGARI